MRHYWIAGALIAHTILSADPAYACMAEQPLDPGHIEHADAVVVGRIADFGIVRRRSPAGNLYDHHARFNVVVEEVLRGPPAKNLSVEWENSTFALPETMGPGPFLIALHKSKPDPVAKSIAPVQGNYDPWTVLQSPCAPPFMFDSVSAQADAVRKILVDTRMRENVP